MFPGGGVTRFREHPGKLEFLVNSKWHLGMIMSYAKFGIEFYLKNYVHFIWNSNLTGSPIFEGFPGGLVVKNPPANVGDTGLIPR